MLYSIFLCSESLPATFYLGGSALLSSAPVTTSTQIYGVVKAFRYAVDLLEVMQDDPLASVRSIPPFGLKERLEPLLQSLPRKEKKLIKFSKMCTPYPLGLDEVMPSHYLCL